MLSDKYSRVLKDAVIAMNDRTEYRSGKNNSGMAMAAAALDAMKWPEILGCIAGDDTISPQCGENLCRQWHQDQFRMVEDLSI